MEAIAILRYFQATNVMLVASKVHLDTVVVAREVASRSTFRARPGKHARPCQEAFNLIKKFRLNEVNIVSHLSRDSKWWTRSEYEVKRASQ